LLVSLQKIYTLFCASDGPTCCMPSFTVLQPHFTSCCALLFFFLLATQCGSRDRDEVQQLLRALSLLLDELSRLPETQPPKKAAAAAGTGDGDGAAADAAKEDAASRAQRHGALPVHTVHAIQEGLSKAGVADKLPPACRKVRGELQLVLDGRWSNLEFTTAEVCLVKCSSTTACGVSTRRLLSCGRHAVACQQQC
jgi:hypothetical protein